MTNRYETVFILTPVLSEDQAKEAVGKFKDLLKEGHGKIRHEENWGMRKLAYPIQKKSSGFYHLIEFESDPALIAKLETEYRPARGGKGAGEGGRAPRTKKVNA